MYLNTSKYNINILDFTTDAYQTEDGTLVIPNCQPIDAGRYVCTITLVTGQSSQSVATLTIDTASTSECIIIIDMFLT